MYSNFYSDNFFFNFLPSFFFLLSLILLSFVKISYRSKEIVFFEEYQPIIIFFSIFAITSLIFNLIIYFDKIYLFRIFIIIYIIFFLLSLILNRNYVLIFKKINSIGQNYKFILLLFPFFLIAILPLSDSDSIAVHLRSATSIFENGLSKINLSKNFEFLSISNAEILLIFSPILKSDNFGAQLNFFTILIFYIITRRNLNFYYFLISCPLFIFLISTQKLQLFFGILFLILFILIQKNKIKSKLELFLLISLISFYASGKVYYVLLSLILIVYLLLNNKHNIKNIFLFGFINFLVIFLPIFLVKYKFFGNPFAPFFDEIFGSSRHIFINYSQALRESQGWLLDYNNLLIYIKPFIPFNLGELTNTLGLVFLLLLFNYKLQKKLYFVPIIIIGIILSTGQILSRYYLEAFLLLIFFWSASDKESRLINSIKYLQLLASIGFAVFFIYLSYVTFDVTRNKNNYMKYFSDGYFNSTVYNKYSKNGSVIALNQNRSNIFSNENIISRSYLKMSRVYENNFNKLNKFIDENNVLYVIANKKNQLQSSCLNLENFAKVNEINATRNFFNHSNQDSFVFKVNAKNC